MQTAALARAGFIKTGKQPCIGPSEIGSSAMLRPWISANLAVSADGKISSVARHPSGWTSKADHQRLLDLRGNADALMVGRGTLEADRMTMTVPEASRQPLRCIVSRSGAISPDHPIFQKPGGQIHLLVTGDPADLIPAGVYLHQDSITGFLHSLAANLQVKRLHCEGGGSLIRALAEFDAIDEFHLTLAGHTVFGGQDAPTATGTSVEFLPDSRAFEISHFDPNPETGECFLTYRRIGVVALDQ
jgi:2,5-diamino-6-(ribosylamino)-4(3H)-pyrimidinone 5'-phosphate reductase